MPLESRCSLLTIRHYLQAAVETAVATALWTIDCVRGQTSMQWQSRFPFRGVGGSRQKNRFHPAPPDAPQMRFVVNIMLALVLLPALVVPIAGGQGELCVVETPLKTQYFTPVVETLAQCHGCRFPAHTPTSPKHTPSVRQVHIVHVEDPEGGAVELVMEGSKFDSNKEPAAQSPPAGRSSRIALVLFSSRERGAPVVFTVTAQGLANDTKHVFLVSGDDEVRGSNLRYSIAHKQRPTKENLISSIEHKFGFVSSYTRVPKANKIILQLPADEETGTGCDVDVADLSPTANCFISIEQPVDGCYHHNMLGENDRDIHIIEVDGSSNSNGSLVLSVLGSNDGGTRAISMAGGSTFVVERNITLVLRTSRPTTWSLHAANIQGTITLLVGGGDQVENTSVPGPGVIVEVRRLDVPATFDQLILTVLTNVGPPVSYTRTTSPNKITITVPPKNEKHIVLPPYIPEYEQTTVYGEDRKNVITKALSVSCDSSSMTVAVPRRISSQVGDISMSLSDHSCLGVMNETHIYITERFEKCKFKQMMSSYQTTYTNYVHIGIGPTISDDEDFDGSGYGSNDDDYHIDGIKVQCDIGPRVVYPEASSTRRTNTESAAGATYKMDVFRDREHQNPVITSDLHTSVNMNQRLYVRTILASVMPWTSAYDANLQIVLEECWLSNSSTYTRPDTPRDVLVRKSCALNPSVALEQRNQVSGFSFKVLPEYAYLGSFYLHCQLGICSGDPLPRPAVNKCLHPGHYCDKIALMKVYDSQPSSSSLQTLTLGPFAMSESTQSALSEKTVQRKMSNSGGNNNVITSGSAVGSSTDEKTRIVNLGGLSTEVVVGIALASFVIGVCLTATLWLIHMKTDPRRQKRPEGGAPRNSGYDLSAHSGSSTPSSQAPMTA